jgi:coproporphyrinogen III oxidase-like Fe-S oxidoreductase
MEIDINIVAHDLLWRRMDIRRKREYVKSWGALKDKLVADEVARLIDDGYAIQHGDDLELTAEGNALYKRMTSRCPKTD